MFPEKGAGVLVDPAADLPGTLATHAAAMGAEAGAVG
jgi:hypothetical protein